MSVIIGLLFCNVIWSLAYPVSKSLMGLFHPMEIAFLRHFFALIPLSVVLLSSKKLKAELRSFSSTAERSDLRMIGIGILTFFASPALQMIALSKTRAIDSSLMVAFEPLITVFLALIFFKEHLRKRQVLSFFMAFIGAYILSDATVEKLLSFQDARIIGNALLIVGVTFEAMVSILSKPILHRRSPDIVMILSLFLGVICLFLYNHRQDPTRVAGLVPLLSSLHSSPLVLVRVMFLGFGCTAFGYLYWIKVLPKAPLSIMALTLYLQPVLGMFWGNIFLDEALSFRHFFGGVVLLVAVFIGTTKVKSLQKQIS